MMNCIAVNITEFTNSWDEIITIFETKNPIFFPIGVSIDYILEALDIKLGVNHRLSSYYILRISTDRSPTHFVPDRGQTISNPCDLTIRIRHEDRRLFRCLPYNPPKVCKFCVLEDKTHKDGTIVVVHRIWGHLRETIYTGNTQGIMRWIGCSCNPLENHKCYDDDWVRIQKWQKANPKRFIKFFSETDKLTSVDKQILFVEDETGKIFIYKTNTNDIELAKIKLATEFFANNHLMSLN